MVIVKDIFCFYFYNIIVLDGKASVKSKNKRFFCRNMFPVATLSFQRSKTIKVEERIKEIRESRQSVLERQKTGFFMKTGLGTKEIRMHFDSIIVPPHELPPSAPR